MNTLILAGQNSLHHTIFSQIGDQVEWVCNCPTLSVLHLFACKLWGKWNLLHSFQRFGRYRKCILRERRIRYKGHITVKQTPLSDHSHSQLQTHSLLGPKSLQRGQLHWTHSCRAWLRAHPFHSHTRFPDQFTPQFPIEGSEFWFLEAIYSQCSKTERTRAGASKEGPPAKEALGFHMSSPSVQKTHSSSSSVLISWVPLGVWSPGSQSMSIFKQTEVILLIIELVHRTRNKQEAKFHRWSSS